MANIQQDIMARDGVEFSPFDVPKDQYVLEKPSALSTRNSDAILRGLLGSDVPSALSRTFQSVYNSTGTLTAAIDDLLGNEEYFEKVLVSPQRLEALKHPVVNLKRLRAYEGEEFIKQCYLQLLGRAADAHGLKNFSSVLGTNGKDFVIQSMITSEEYTKRVIPRQLVEG